MNIAAFSIVSKGDNRRVQHEITADRRGCAGDRWGSVRANLAIHPERLDLAIDGLPYRDSDRDDDGKRAPQERGAANQLPRSDRNVHLYAELDGIPDDEQLAHDQQFNVQQFHIAWQHDVIW